MCSPLWFPFLRTWCLLEAPWKGGVVERICSAASEHPPTLWKEINATYSTPLPFKVWAMCHNISMTLEVIRNTVSKALPQTSCRIRICSLTKFQRISLHTEIWEALHTLLPIQPELSLLKVPVLYLTPSRWKSLALWTFPSSVSTSKFRNIHALWASPTHT